MACTSGGGGGGGGGDDDDDDDDDGSDSGRGSENTRMALAMLAVEHSGGKLKNFRLSSCRG